MLVLPPGSAEIPPPRASTSFSMWLQRQGSTALAALVFHGDRNKSFSICSLSDDYWVPTMCQVLRLQRSINMVLLSKCSSRRAKQKQAMAIQVHLLDCPSFQSEEPSSLRQDICCFWPATLRPPFFWYWFFSETTFSHSMFSCVSISKNALCLHDQGGVGSSRMSIRLCWDFSVQGWPTFHSSHPTHGAWSFLGFRAQILTYIWVSGISAFPSILWTILVLPFTSLFC